MMKEDKIEIFEINKIFWTSQEYIEDSINNRRISKIKEISDNDIDNDVNKNNDHGGNGDNNDDNDNDDTDHDDDYDDDELSGVFPLKLKNTRDQEQRYVYTYICVYSIHLYEYYI
jgi:hypothetical protein